MIYLIWSHEHSAWWKAGGIGYTSRISQAGRFDRQEAIRICTRAIPGADALGALAELPVLLADVEEMIAIDHAEYPGADTPKTKAWK
jgi:hypothetical protein